VCDIVVKKFTFAILSRDEFLYWHVLQVVKYVSLKVVPFIRVLRSVAYLGIDGRGGRHRCGPSPCAPKGCRGRAAPEAEA